MKNVMYSIGLMAAVVLAGVNVFFVVQDGRKDLLNVEKTQASMSGDDVANCDIYKYRRYAVEDYDYVTTVKGQITINGEVKFSVNLGGSVEGEVTVRVPVCNPDQYNCCEKAHMQSDVLFP